MRKLLNSLVMFVLLLGLVIPANAFTYFGFGEETTSTTRSAMVSREDFVGRSTSVDGYECSKYPEAAPISIPAGKTYFDFATSMVGGDRVVFQVYEYDLNGNYRGAAPCSTCLAWNQQHITQAQAHNDEVLLNNKDGWFRWYGLSTSYNYKYVYYYCDTPNCGCDSYSDGGCTAYNPTTKTTCATDEMLRKHTCTNTACYNDFPQYLCAKGFNCVAPPACTDTCSSLGATCGSKSVCGSTTNCGSCNTGYTCSSNVCVPNSVNPPADSTLPIISESKPADVSASGDTISVTFHLKNSGGAMNSNWLIEIEPKLVLSNAARTYYVSEQKVCHAVYPENVHKDFKLGAGETIDITLQSKPSVSGNYYIDYVSADQCCVNSDGTSPNTPCSMKNIGGKLSGPFTIKTTDKICDDKTCVGNYLSCATCVSWCGDKICDRTKEDASWCGDCPCKADGECMPGCTTENDPDCGPKLDCVASGNNCDSNVGTFNPYAVNEKCDSGVCVNRQSGKQCEGIICCKNKDEYKIVTSSDDSKLVCQSYETKVTDATELNTNCNKDNLNFDEILKIQAVCSPTESCSNTAYCKLSAECDTANGETISTSKCSESTKVCCIPKIVVVPTTCSSDTDCNDKNSCTTDKCSTDKKCVNEQITGCSGGNTTTGKSTSYTLNEWLETSAGGRIGSLCNTADDCAPYEDLTGSDKEYEVSCKAPGQITTKLQEDATSICDKQGKSGENWKGYLIGGSVGCAGGLAITAGLVGSGIGIPAAILTGTGAVITCIAGATTGAAILTGVQNVVKIDCQSGKYDGIKGACIAIPKGTPDMDICKYFVFLEPYFKTNACTAGIIGSLLFIILFIYIITKPNPPRYR